MVKLYISIIIIEKNGHIYGTFLEDLLAQVMIDVDVTRTFDVYRNMLVSMRYNSFWIIWENRVYNSVGSTNKFFFVLQYVTSVRWYKPYSRFFGKIEVNMNY